MAAHNDLGKKGEELAKQRLIADGYEILHENWRCNHVEADLIASKHNLIIFIEVKTRSGTAFGEPEEFVGYAKQKNLTFLAERYIEMKEYNGEIRFDIISILFGNDGSFKLRHLEDAFWPGF